MSIAIKVEVAEAVALSLVHDLRNCGEEIYGALRDVCSVDLHEIDSATSSFVIRDIRKRDLGLAMEVVKRAIRRYRLEGSAKLIRLDRE
jgi:hypothetical protein